jgi:hypothetical protein
VSFACSDGCLLLRVIVRRERSHPGAQLSLFEERDGWRYTAFVTNTQVGALQWLEARHRAHARVEDRIRCVAARCWELTLESCQWILLDRACAAGPEDLAVDGMPLRWMVRCAAA